MARAAGRLGQRRTARHTSRLGHGSPDAASSTAVWRTSVCSLADRSRTAADVHPNVDAIRALRRSHGAGAQGRLVVPRSRGRSLSHVHPTAAPRSGVGRVGLAVPAIRFDGQVAVVTGAGRGLGAAYARLIAMRGGAVVVHDAGVAQDGSGFDPSVADGIVAEIAAQGGTAAACYENLEDPAAGQRIVDFAIKRFGRLDALVHNAGLVVFAALDETTPAVWDRMIAIGVDAGFHLARAAVPHMRRQGYGRIVLTTSGRAMRVEDCVPGLVAYSTAKMAQVGLMVGLAAELADTDIRVNAISPVAATRVLRRQAPELLADLVAPGVAFLASSACTTSGVVLNAAGGRFSASWWDRGETVDLGPTASPETIAGHWQRFVAPPPEPE